MQDKCSREYTGSAILQKTSIYYCSNARVGGEFKGLILASTDWNKIFEAGFHFSDMIYVIFYYYLLLLLFFFFAVSRTDHQNLYL